MSAPLKQIRRQVERRYRQVRDTWELEGPRWISNQARARLAEWIVPTTTALPVLRSDVLAANLERPFNPGMLGLNSGDQPILNWILIPAGPKSGGNTTIFRIIRYLESNGYVNRIYFYNVHRCDQEYYKAFVRDYYGFYGPVSSVEKGMEDAHGIVATSWPTAYPAFNSRCKGRRFYFVQDFEPAFYPVGSLCLLAENTYRMGFHAITAGKWLADKLRAEFKLTTDWFDFGSDSSHYRRKETHDRRTGVVFYARPEAARRGFELGIMALEILAARHLEIELHCYGATLGKQPFMFTDHGRVTPMQLNDIYNRCCAGLSLSLTNVSLVPHEMLAAGCIPVVNDAIHNRVVLDNPFVRYAPPNPNSLAVELERIISCSNFEPLSVAAAASVTNTTWEHAGATVDAIVRRALGQPTFCDDLTVRTF